MHNVLQTLIELCRSVKLQPLYLMEGLSRYFTIDLRSKNQFIAFNQQQAEFLEHTYQLVITFI